MEIVKSQLKKKGSGSARRISKTKLFEYSSGQRRFATGRDLKTYLKRGKPRSFDYRLDVKRL